MEHSSSSATALITDTRTVQVFAQGIIVCVIVTASGALEALCDYALYKSTFTLHYTARALVTVLSYLCVLKCLFIIIIIIIMLAGVRDSFHGLVDQYIRLCFRH